MEGREKTMFQIGQVCQRLGLNPQTVYFYERIGLIPSPQRTEAGYRLFSSRVGSAEPNHLFTVAICVLPTLRFFYS